MNKKLLFALILASSVTCQASIKPMPTEVLTPENVPTVPQSLLQPIEISDQKSATGEAELRAYDLLLGKVNDRLDVIMKKPKMQLYELDSAVTTEKKQQLRSEIIASREKVWFDTQKEMETLSRFAKNTQDKEVKALIEHDFQLFSLRAEVWHMMVNRKVDKVSSLEEEERKLKKAVSVSEEKMFSALDVSETAAKKLAEKYQVD